jgi:hypothetical protein
MALIDTLASAIAQMEGYNVLGSVAQRNNNPGNLRASPYATGTDSKGYAIFPDAATGQEALMYQLSLYSGRGMDLQQMINVYAPASDNNNPSNYLNFITGQLGVGPSTSLSALYDTTNTAVSSDVSQSNTDASSTAGFTNLDFLSSWVPTGITDGTAGTGVYIGLGLLGIAAFVFVMNR